MDYPTLFSPIDDKKDNNNNNNIRTPSPRLYRTPSSESSSPGVIRGIRKGSLLNPSGEFSFIERNFEAVEEKVSQESLFDKALKDEVLARVFLMLDMEEWQRLRLVNKR
jgi:hypothetical protein